MGTLNGAVALGVNGFLGSIQTGKQAALSCIEFADAGDRTGDPLESIFAAETTCVPLI